MITYRKIHSTFAKCAQCVIVSLFVVLATVANAAEPGQARLAAQLKQQGALITQNGTTGKVRFIRTYKSSPISVSQAERAFSARDSAMIFVQNYGPLFGLRDPQKELQVMKERVDADGRSMVRYQQVYLGVPVIGGELLVNMDAQRKMTSMNGEISPSLSLQVDPALSAEDATNSALAAVSKWYKISTSKLTVTKPTLSIYDPQLISPRKTLPQLVWRLEVRTSEPLVRELVLVDAVRGGILLNFSQIYHAKDRTTYDAENITSNNLPGGTMTTPVCTEASGDACTSGTRPDADLAHLYAGNTYDFYMTYHNRDSLDNAGMTLISTVRFCPVGSTCPYANAFWNGTQMAYGDGFSQADDVVGHELTHGVTEKTSNLFYWYQSGAINESFSDVWGEFIDLTNSGGTDTSGVRWLMGEDIPGLGAIRSMADPTIYGDPDKMTSANYYVSLYGDDNGGVHANSGINNKAVYLMTDGGSFNGHTITGLGISKTAKVYYEAQTNLLTSGSDYADLKDALWQGCQNLIGGPAGITADDCVQVLNATQAVEMDQQPSNTAALNPDAAVCPAGKVASELFADDFEGTLSTNWESASMVGGNSWSQLTPANGGPYSTSGSKSVFINDVSTVSDTVLRMKSDVLLPAGAYMHFRHSFLFEYGLPDFYDGGVLEYSTNGGSSWTDAAPLFDSGKGYGGTLDNTFSNPIGGRQAFVGTSNGFVSSRYDLSSLAGNNTRFRFRLGTDNSGAGFAWIADDVKVYTCIDPPPTTVYGAVLPVSRSVQVGQTATAFATILNAGVNTGYSCSIAPATSIPATFSYQTTDSGTNAVTGLPNTPVNISAGGAQTFVFAFTPTAPISPTDVQLTFDCLNSDPAPIYSNAAVNTLLFSADTNPVPDIVAQGATLTGDGIVNIPGTNGNTLFAVGSSNVGIAGDITVSADTGSAVLPVVLNVCETNPGTGACTSAIAPTVTVNYTGGTNRSFAIFVSGTGTVPFDPANNRVIVRFKDGGSITRGATSVAVRTQ